MSAQKTGTNGPALPVPLEEEEAPRPAQATESNPFGEAAAPEGEQKPAADPFGEAAAAEPASEFSDAVAIQIPSQAVTDARKPYFLFGDAQNTVDLWFFDLARPDPQLFTGRGSADLAQKDLAGLTGVASYHEGEWSVIFKRPLRPASAAPFAVGEFLPVAFSVWDGFSRERGNKRGLTLWYSVYLEPENVPSAVGPMFRTALIILVLEIAVVGWVRWRYGSGARSEPGAQPSHPAATSA
jgi:hypothetical protein